ncbi:IPT/TIG domain-containing protein [Paraflavitalea sp. CAU 1676]|uniref:IPT/TIG domain-containing protein n=1 Tax=Paraflavitalea sp. CAU 1676 TaxID=3032598 RepID=UPI0023DABDD2|nr:IPT/TIG domain-containing protein [Paraflavitalea sp. CAU 1676]MDF2192670.1 IPT/TIG domain-containing protein [Paraflavitalea sp. CAU 1676]
MKRLYPGTLLLIGSLLLFACNKEGKTPILEIDKTSIVADAQGGKDFLLITSNSDWEITGLPEGITATPDKGQGDRWVTITYPANTGIESIDIKFTIKSKEASPVEIGFKQLGSAPSILVDKQIIGAVGSGQEQTITIISNTSWKLDIPANGAWVKASKTAGDPGQSTVVLTISESNEPRDRSTELTISHAATNTSVKVSVSQLQPDVLLTAITPHAKGEEVITITGKGFSSAKADNVVTINGKASTITEATLTSLKVTVPLRAGSGKVQVTVAAKTSNPVDFKYDSVWRTYHYAENTDPAALGNMHHIAADDAGNLFITVPDQHLINKINADGILSLFAGGTKGYQNGMGAEAWFNRPQGIAINKYNALFIADWGNRAVRRLTPGGTSNTMAAFSYTTGLDGIAADDDGISYVADSIYGAVVKVNNVGGTWADVYKSGKPVSVARSKEGILYVAHTDHRIYKVNINGTVEVFAGSTAGLKDGQGAAAQFNEPGQLAVDPKGNLYVADTKNNSIRKISPAGLVSTIAGDGTAGDLIGLTARFSAPLGITMDKLGNLFITDTQNHKVKRVLLE